MIARPSRPRDRADYRAKAAGSRPSFYFLLPVLSTKESLCLTRQSHTNLTENLLVGRLCRRSVRIDQVPDTGRPRSAGCQDARVFCKTDEPNHPPTLGRTYGPAPAGPEEPRRRCVRSRQLQAPRDRRRWRLETESISGRCSVGRVLQKTMQGMCKVKRC